MVRPVLERNNFIDNWEIKVRTATKYDISDFV